MVIVTQKGNVITSSDVYFEMGDLPEKGGKYTLHACAGGRKIEVFSHIIEPTSQEPEKQRGASLPEVLRQTLVNLIKAKTEVIDIREIIDQYYRVNLKGGVICRFLIDNFEGCGLIYAKDYEQAEQALSQNGNINHFQLVIDKTSYSKVGEFWKMSGGNERIYFN